MKQYTFSELKAVIESHIEYQLEHAFNRAEWVENGAYFELKETAFTYIVYIRYAVNKEIVGEAPNDEVVYKNNEIRLVIKKDEPINIIQVLNRVDDMLEQATAPYFLT